MNTFFYQKIEDIFTQRRLSVYRNDGVDDITCLAIIRMYKMVE